MSAFLFPLRSILKAPDREALTTALFEDSRSIYRSLKIVSRIGKVRVRLVPMRVSSGHLSREYNTHVSICTCAAVEPCICLCIHICTYVIAEMCARYSKEIEKKRRRRRKVINL